MIQSIQKNSNTCFWQLVVPWRDKVIRRNMRKQGCLRCLAIKFSIVVYYFVMKQEWTLLVIKFLLFWAQEYIKNIRAAYTKDFTSKDVSKRQIAVATYLIDKLALRAGNEKVLVTWNLFFIKKGKVESIMRADVTEWPYIFVCGHTNTHTHIFSHMGYGTWHVCNSIWQGDQNFKIENYVVDLY